jgi:HK97 family phage prohead protease
MKKKSIKPSGVKVVDAAEGKVTAVFATLNVKDSDGDVTLKGAFEEGAPVRVSAYNHASWKEGHLPVGKGTIREDGDEAIADLQFFLNTTAGRDTFEVVKQTADLQEWSYGFDVLDSEPGQKDGEKVTFLKSLKVHEVSPVILGAGIGTRTLTAKGKQLASDLADALREAGSERFGDLDTYVYPDEWDIDEGWVVFSISSQSDYLYQQVSFTREPDGTVTLGDDPTEVQRTTAFRPKGDMKFTEHIKSVVADVDELTNRASEVMAMRREKGKTISQESREALAELEPSLKKLDEVLNPVEPIANKAMLDVEFERGRQLLRR